MEALADVYTIPQEHLDFRDTIRQIAQERVAPRAAEIDEKAEYPQDIRELFAEHDLFGLPFETEYGGTGTGALMLNMAIEEVSKVCASSALMLMVQELGTLPIRLFGTEEQKQRFLPRCATGEWTPAFALSEPEAGSDPGGMITRAERDGDEWVINGTKNWITNGPVADAIVLFTMTDLSKGTKGITAFVVDTDTPGFLKQKADEKLGICASPSCTIFFENMEVPAGQRLGAEGEGFKIAMSTLDGGRIGIAAQAIGIARAAFEEARDYSKVRKTFDVPIAQHQAIQFMLADMATELEAARLLTLRAASLKDRGLRHTRESSMAKLFASEAANRVADKAVQIHGGMGYSKELDVERHFRDARITEIYEGTSEIQRLVISNALLK